MYTIPTEFPSLARFDVWLSPSGPGTLAVREDREGDPMSEAHPNPPAAGAWIASRAETPTGLLWDTLAVLAGSMLVAAW